MLVEYYSANLDLTSLAGVFLGEAFGFLVAFFFSCNALFAAITSRLYSLQISDREKYEILSDKNRLREWKTPPQRGIIKDYFNNMIDT